MEHISIDCNIENGYQEALVKQIVGNDGIVDDICDEKSEVKSNGKDSKEEAKSQQEPGKYFEEKLDDIVRQLTQTREKKNIVQCLNTIHEDQENVSPKWH